MHESQNGEEFPVGQFQKPEISSWLESSVQPMWIIDYVDYEF